MLGVAVLLTACASANRVDKDSSMLETPKSMEIGSSFKLLQLTDIHFSYATDIAHESTFLSKTVEYASPDLIVITGDSLLNASKTIAETLFSLIDSWQIPYYYILGNHDLQGFYSESWLLNKLYASEYCLNSEYGATSKSGRTDSVLNLQKNGKTIFQIYSLDSHSVTNIDGVYCYDYLKDDQIEWYVNETERAKEENGGYYVPSIGFIHIPLWEIVDAYIANNEGIIGEIHKNFAYKKVPELSEKLGSPLPFCPGAKNSGFFEASSSRGMKGIFFGHDHNNDWVGEYKGVAIGYGVKSGRELFYGVNNKGLDMIGGALYTIKDDASYSIKHFYLSDEDYSLTHEEETNRR